MLAIIRKQCAPMGPKVSVIWYGRNNVASAKESIAALQAQSYSNFEFIVDDGGSTDGTLAVFQSAAAHDPRIRIFTGMPASSGESLISALRRCRGDYIAICPNEGRLLPNALEVAVSQFALRPEAGAICASGFLIDGHGATLEPVDIVTLLLTSYRPFLPAGFFNRQVLVAAGLDDEDWLTESVELELCYRIATTQGIHSVAQVVVECRDPQRQPNGLPRSVKKAIEERLRLVSKVFSAEGFFGPDCEALALESKANQLSILWQEFRCLGEHDIEYLVLPPLSAVAWELDALMHTDHRALRSLHRLLCVRSHNLGILSPPLQKLFSYTTELRGRPPLHISYFVWNFPFYGAWLKQKIIKLTLPLSDFHRSAPQRAAMFADIYSVATWLYDARGQIELALEMVERARPPDDMPRDSLACQAMLRLPAVTDEKLASFQNAWVRRYIGDQPIVSLPTPNIQSGGRKVRIGYHCSFMDGDTIRYMMSKVMAAHDRSRFEVFGYTPTPLPDDIKRSFDVVRTTAIAKAHRDSAMVGTTPTMSENEFVDLVRRDQIDVFVELSGFSIGHRFVSMSRRCAPVQVSFLNHTASSQVPNVDYILADEICIPSSSCAQSLYSEKIYRLPGCFFSFDYSGSDYPAIVEPPSLNGAPLTFGCFGSGFKINLTQIEWWSRLLHRVPQAILRLQNAQLDIYDNRRFMAQRFRRFGIGRERLLFSRSVNRRLLLDAYNHVDISLDTWPYCGGNTIGESLWMGVPVITLKGDRFGSRYGASLVTAAGCADLIGETPEQYIDIAVRLANDLPRLRSLRQNLRRMSFEYGLGDSTLFARRLEVAYIDMLGALKSGTIIPSRAGASVAA
jgi:glycosyltransferase involved in cell wall biosynthesis